MFAALCTLAPWKGAQFCPVLGVAGQRPLPTHPPGFLLQVCLSWYQAPRRGARLDANFDDDSNTPHLPNLCQF